MGCPIKKGGNMSLTTVYMAKNGKETTKAIIPIIDKDLFLDLGFVNSEKEALENYLKVVPDTEKLLSKAGKKK